MALLAASSGVWSHGDPPPGSRAITGTWYWRTLSAGVNRWHSTQGEGVLVLTGDRFELDLRDGTDGSLNYVVKGRVAGRRLQGTVSKWATDLMPFQIAGDVVGSSSKDHGSWQIITFRRDGFVLALTRETANVSSSASACGDPRYDALAAEGARSVIVTRPFSLPPEAWRPDVDAACATVLLTVGKDQRAENIRVVEAYPKPAAIDAVERVIHAYTFDDATGTELALRFHITPPDQTP
ncbi:hypothetical protein [Luteibacter aegosomatissinici]|uniref:hypothetical protein n=1 Tax=Luteibacter aegosomatissinici TaxID=2911539 RepID=UPI001FFC0F0E|nr:hypothetical protein [Luteibacter aegosomatissinici]UPG93694.1 hypothetical protein L2Y97_17895 [Luteibacter aegosomatissinici]